MTIAIIVFVFYVAGAVLTWARVNGTYASRHRTWQLCWTSWIGLVAAGIFYFEERTDPNVVFLRFRDPAKLKARRELAEQKVKFIGDLKEAFKKPCDLCNDTRKVYCRFTDTTRDCPWCVEGKQTVLAVDYANHPVEPGLWK